MITIQEYANKIGISTEKIFSRSRRKDLVTARGVYFYYLRKVYNYTLQEIADIFSMGHSNVFMAIKKIENYIMLRDNYTKRYLDVLNISN